MKIQHKYSLFDRIHRKFYYFLEYMIWIISRRTVLKRLHEMRWHVPEERIKPPYVTTGENHSRWAVGVKRDDFETQLVLEEAILEASFLSRIYQRIRPRYIVIYRHQLKHVLDECIGEYIKVGRDNRLALNSKGEEIIKWYYYPRIFFTNSWVKTIGTGIIMIFVTWYITQMISNKVSDVIIDNYEQQK